MGGSIITMDRWIDTIPTEPGELGAAEELQRDTAPDTTGDGGMIGRLLIAIGMVFACLALVHVITRALA